MAEQEASASARGLKTPNFEKVAFFSTHPPDAERANTLAALAAPDVADRDDGADRYPAALAPWLPTFLDDPIKLNDFGRSAARRAWQGGVVPVRSRWGPIIN